MGTTTTKTKQPFMFSVLQQQGSTTKKKKQYRDHTSNKTQKQNKTNKASWTPTIQHK